jgi:DNA modification methylase
MIIKEVTLGSIHQDPGNVRTHGPKNMEAICESLARFGQAEPLVVQESSGRVIGGNGRLEAMKLLGWEKCEIVELDVDDAQARALAVALNRTAELADWNEAELTKLLEALREEDALDGVGFDEAEIDRLVAQLAAEEADLDEDSVEERPEHSSSLPGDLWLLGEHRLLCGDSTNRDDVRRLLDGATPFLMVTDPPYGVSYDPEWRNRAGISETKRTGTVSNDDRVDWTAAYELFPGTVAYVWHAGRYAAEFAEHLQSCGLEIRSQIVWRKPRFAISRGHYHWQHEPCWYAVREGKSSKWCGDRSQSTVWDIEPCADDEATRHGTQKPVECMGRPIRNHGTRDDAVYDPFVGSGSTLIAAERLKRRCFAMELDPGYVDVVVRRWEKATGEQATLEGDGRSFVEIAEARLLGEEPEED